MSRVHLVTGAGRGIGRAVAARLLANGDSVAVLDLGCHVDGSGTDDSVAASTVAELGGDALAIGADVRDAAQVDRALGAILDRWGRLDGVLNFAAILRTGNVLTTTDDDWDQTLDVNLRGAMLVGRAAVRHWVATDAPGRIVNVTSAAGLEGNAEMFAYSTSKAALIGLTLATSHAVACRDILANAIAPLAASRMAVRGLGDAALEVRERTGAWPDVATERGLPPEFVAPLAAYLVSESLTATGRVFTAGGGTVTRLPIPVPEVTVTIDAGMSQDEVDALFDATIAQGVELSRWQVDELPLDTRPFPVEALD